MCYWLIAAAPSPAWAFYTLSQHAPMLRPVRILPAPARPAPLLPAPIPCWHECLACNLPLEGQKYSRQASLCEACYQKAPEHERGFYQMAMAFWRKMHKTGFRLKEFVTKPSPWQVTLHRLGMLLMGFRGTEMSVGTEREGADAKLGVHADDLYEMMSGKRPLAAPVRVKLATIGLGWFTYLRRAEKDDPADAEWVRSGMADVAPQVEAEL